MRTSHLLLGADVLVLIKEKEGARLNPKQAQGLGDSQGVPLPCQRPQDSCRLPPFPRPPMDVCTLAGSTFTCSSPAIPPILYPLAQAPSP